MIESAIKQENNKKRNKKNQRKSVAKKMKKTKMNFMTMAVVIISVTVFAIPIWNNLGEIKRKKEHIAELKRQYEHMKIENDALKQKVDAPVDEEYIIEIAKNNGYRQSDEIIFYLNGGG